MSSYHLARGTFCVLAVLVAMISSNCGSWVPEVRAPLDAPVIPLSTEEAAGVLSQASRQGTLPCGVFDVNGFGHKTVSLADFPDCTSSQYQVLCLDRMGKWRAAHVTNVETRSSAQQVTFTVSQDGTCGLFPN